jgi:pyruvate dehydrogenase E1 component
MFVEQDNVFFYITVMNENYAHPPMPEGVEEGIIKGLYLLKQGEESNSRPKVQLMGSGTILREVEAAAEVLREQFGVESNVWSATSMTELRREGLDAHRWNTLHPDAEPRKSYVEQCLEGRKGPVVAATDYIKAYADQIRGFVPARYAVLGTDGFGRSDTRAQLRKHFEVDRDNIVLAALKTLADDGEIPARQAAEAITKLGLDPDKPNPVTV